MSNVTRRRLIMIYRHLMNMPLYQLLHNRWIEFHSALYYTYKGIIGVISTSLSSCSNGLGNIGHYTYSIDVVKAVVYHIQGHIY